MKKDKLIEMWSGFFTRQDKVDFVNDLNNLLESQHKELIEREQRIRKFWDVSPHDFDVIANGKGTLECGTQIRNQ